MQRPSKGQGGKESRGAHDAVIWYGDGPLGLRGVRGRVHGVGKYLPPTKHVCLEFLVRDLLSCARPWSPALRIGDLSGGCA